MITKRNRSFQSAPFFEVARFPLLLPGTMLVSTSLLVSYQEMETEKMIQQDNQSAHVLPNLVCKDKIGSMVVVHAQPLMGSAVVRTFLRNIASTFWQNHGFLNQPFAQKLLAANPLTNSKMCFPQNVTFRIEIASQKMSTKNLM